MSYVHDVKYAVNGAYWNLPDINVRGLVLHSVGCAQPHADVFAKVFNSPSAKASIHGCIEPGRFIEMAPIYKQSGRAKKCYHVGSGPKGSRNNTHLGIEMTEPATIKYTGGASFIDFNPANTKKHIEEVTDTAAQVFADLCIFHNIPVEFITTHRQSHLDGFGGNHGDPEHIWKVTGYTLADFRKAVQKYIDAKKGDVLALMTKEEFNQILDEKLAAVKKEAVEAAKKVVPTETVYRTIDNVPTYAKDSVEKAMKAGIINGTGGSVGGKATIDLSVDLMRTIVILDRLGMFDEKKDVEKSPSGTVVRKPVTKVPLKNKAEEK